MVNSSETAGGVSGVPRITLCFSVHWGVAMAMGLPQNRWMLYFMENPIWKWMMILTGYPHGHGNCRMTWCIWTMWINVNHVRIWTFLDHRNSRSTDCTSLFRSEFVAKRGKGTGRATCSMKNLLPWNDFTCALTVKYRNGKAMAIVAQPNFSFSKLIWRDIFRYL